MKVSVSLSPISSLYYRLPSPPSITDSPLFIKFSKLIGKQFYTTKWEETISDNDQSRLKFYKEIKSDLEPAKYTLLPFYQRKVIAKLRCSSHDLEIERGRHKKKITEDRLCLMCPEKSIEDENHFLSRCVAYRTHRLRHGYTDKTPIEIMNDLDQNNLFIYLSKAFDLRKKHLEIL